MTTTINPDEISSIIQAGGRVLEGLGEHTPGLISRTVYEDDKIWISHLGLGSSRISIFLEGDWIRVFACKVGEDSATIFRRGAWMNYLQGPLLSRAEESIAIMKEQEATRLDQEIPERFEPIDDDAVFGLSA